MNTQVLGISVDSTACLKAWAESLGGITYPLLSDFYPHGEIARKYGVLRPEGYSERAIFVINKQGLIYYADVHDIDTQPDNDVLFSVLAELEPQAASVLKSSQKITTSQPESDVIMYCTPWCPACRRARAYLQEKGIQYVEVDISRDRLAAEKVRGWTQGYETTPTFNIRGDIIVDFDREKLDQALAG